MEFHCLWCTPKKLFRAGKYLLKGAIPVNICHHHLASFGTGLQLLGQHPVDVCFWSWPVLGHDPQRLFELLPCPDAVHVCLTETKKLPPDALKYDIFECIQLPMNKRVLRDVIIQGLSSRFYPNHKMEAFQDKMITLGHSKNQVEIIPLDTICRIENKPKAVAVDCLWTGKKKYKFPFLWIRIQCESLPHFFALSPNLMINLNNVSHLVYSPKKIHYCCFKNGSEIQISPTQKKTMLKYIENVTQDVKKRGRNTKDFEIPVKHLHK